MSDTPDPTPDMVDVSRLDLFEDFPVPRRRPGKKSEINVTHFEFFLKGKRVRLKGEATPVRRREVPLVLLVVSHVLDRLVGPDWTASEIASRDPSSTRSVTYLRRV